MMFWKFTAHTHCSVRCFQAEGMKIPGWPARYGVVRSIPVHREACCWVRSIYKRNEGLGL